MSTDRTTSPLLSVKQTIPPVRPGLVARRRLEQAFDGSETKLTLVVAPAGWGKTSLLSRWASVTSSGRPVAWVSLDESDDEPVRFWEYVVAALSRVSPALSTAALEALPASSEGPMSRALPILLNELTESSVGHVLVLDDYHVITHPDIHESVEYLISYLPPTLRIFLASRWDPPFPLARLRVRGDLTEVRADDLRFTRDESVALISALSDVEADPSAAVEAWEHTEGWAAGLQLAGLTLRARARATGTPIRIRGDDRHVFDYFTAEVFPTLEPRQRDLLVRAAPLDLLSGSLCDAALDTTGSAAILAELEQADLFVVDLDGRREWFRCHRLLRDALLRSHGAASEAETREVRRRAARWFEEHDRVDDAVRQLLSCGDHDDAARLLAASQQWFLERGWSATYLALGARLPESALPPQLALFLTYAAEVSGHHDEVAHWLDICRRQTDDDTVVDGWGSPYSPELTLRALVGTPASQPARIVALCEQAVALETAAGFPHQPVAMLALGTAYGLDGRFEEAVRILADSWRQRGTGLWSLQIDLQVAEVLSLFLLQLGRHDELDRCLAQADPLADVAERDWGDGAAHVVAMVRLVQARRAYERGDMAQAGERLGSALRQAEIATRAWIAVIGQIYLADLELAIGHRDAARVALVRAHEVLDNEPVPPFVGVLLDDAETRIGRSALRAVAATGALVEPLTDREMSILRLLPGSATQREIGAALYLSINTVKAYNKSLYRKLGVGGRQDAVRVARQLGLI